MKKKPQAMRKVAALLLGVAVCLPSAVQAEKERRSPLTNAPVIRKRVELRDKRFEIGVGMGVSIGQDFYNALLVTPKLAFHFTDWISIAAVAGYNVYPGWKSSFNDDLNNALPTEDATAAPSLKSPYRDEAQAGMNRIGYVFVGQAEFIPLSGKIAILSSLFTYFDFYILLGGGVVNLAAATTAKPVCVLPDASTSATDHVCHLPNQVFTTSQFTFTGGVGAHAFLGRWAALNLELHDFIYKNNASGRDVNGDKQADARDRGWTNNFVFSLNLQVFFPTTAKISR